MDVSIQGLQEAQRDNLAMIRALTPYSGLGEAVKLTLVDLDRYAVSVTHVDTGALRASHRIQMDALEGTLSIQDGARNPRSGRLTSEYGPIEHERGDSHAFYERTFEERGDRALEIGASALIRSLN